MPKSKGDDFFPDNSDNRMLSRTIRMQKTKRTTCDVNGCVNGAMRLKNETEKNSFKQEV